MNSPLDRFLLLIQLENVKMPWLEEKTGIGKKRWSSVKAGAVEMRAAETQALCEIWPEYALWLASGNEAPEVGQISPLTKKAHQTLKPTPKAG